MIGFVNELKSFRADIQKRLQAQEERMTMLDRKNISRGRAPLSVEADAGAPHQKAFDAYIRHGDDDALRGLPLEGKAMSTVSDGGFLAAPTVALQVQNALNVTASLRRVANVVTVESANYEVLVDMGDIASGWSTEATAQAETGTSTVQRVVIPVHELSAMPKASQRLLDDAAFDIGQLMGDLARHKGGKAKFVEKKYFAILDKPVVSTGEMTYTAPDRLEKRTLTPKVETLLLDKDILSIERDKQKLSINLANQPEALAFVDSIRGTLSGNRAALEKNYALHLAGNADKWVLTLLPSDQKIASLVQRITVSGNKNQVRVIEYLQADGDRSVLNIDPVDVK